MKSLVPACLILHGFAGNTGEVSPLCEFLEARGFAVECPTLAGHSGRRKDLARSTSEDWLASARICLKRLKQQHTYVILIGFSMGGLIAARLSLEMPVDKLILLSTPVFVWDFQKIIQNLRQDWKLKKREHLSYYLHNSFDKPIAALFRFNRFMHQTKNLFCLVTPPVLICHGLNDSIVKYKSAKYIYENILSHQKKLKFYRGANHLICHSENRQKIFQDILDFIMI